MQATNSALIEEICNKATNLVNKSVAEDEEFDSASSSDKE